MKRRLETRQTINKITYNPNKHKNQSMRNLRSQLKDKKTANNNPKKPTHELKFGSFNVDGLGLDAAFAAIGLLHGRGFDVSRIYMNLYYYL